MERDFLGLNARETTVAMKEEVETRNLKFMVNESVDGLSKDSRFPVAAFIGSSGLQWPFVNKALPFMSIRGGHVEGRPTKIVPDQLSSSILQSISTVDAFDAHCIASTAAKFQNSFTLDTHNPHRMHESHLSIPSATYPVPVKATAAYQHPQESRSNLSISASISIPYSKPHGASVCTSPANLVPAKPFGGIPVAAHHSVLPVVAAATPPYSSRSIYSASATPTPPAAQLTIFYAGSVNVYDNVPLEKARAIMFMMGNGPHVVANPHTSKNQAPSTNGFHGNVMASASSGLPIPDSGTSQLQLLSPHSGVQSVGGSTSTEEVIRVRTTKPLACNIQQEALTLPSVPGGGTFISQGAIPQARKASLARFLEKRKERVLSTAPYAKKPEASKENNPVTPNATSAAAAKEDDATS